MTFYDRTFKGEEYKDLSEDKVIFFIYLKATCFSRCKTLKVVNSLAATIFLAKKEQASYIKTVGICNQELTFPIIPTY